MSLITDSDEHHTPTDSKWPSGTFVLEVCLCAGLVSVSHNDDILKLLASCFY